MKGKKTELGKVDLTSHVRGCVRVHGGGRRTNACAACIPVVGGGAEGMKSGAPRQGLAGAEGAGYRPLQRKTCSFSHGTPMRSNPIHSWYFSIFNLPRHDAQYHFKSDKAPSLVECVVNLCGCL